MSDGDRLHYALAVALAIGLILIATAMQPNTLRGAETQSEQACTEKTYRIKHEPDGQPFLSILTEPKPCEQQNATSEHPGTSYPPRNVAEADLLAQKRMAHWTFWIGVFTATGLSVLYITFHATREAVVETRKIGEAQTRGYIEVSKVRLLASDDDGKPRVDVMLVNSGQTPCYNVVVLSGIDFREEQKPNDWIAFDREKDLFGNNEFVPVARNGTESSVYTKYTRWTRNERASRIIQSGLAMHYFGEIHYTDVFDERWIVDFYFVLTQNESDQNKAKNSRPKRAEGWNPAT